MGGERLRRANPSGRSAPKLNELLQTDPANVSVEFLFQAVNQFVIVKRKQDEVIARAQRAIKEVYDHFSPAQRVFFFAMLYDQFSENYDRHMGVETRHYQAIRTVMDFAAPFLRPPIVDLTAGTGDVSGNLSLRQTTGETLFQKLGQADLIVNCAAVVSDSGRRREFRTGNITTLENLLSVLSAYPNTKLVHVSSAGVYDLGGTVREETEFTRSRVLYRRTKRMGHELLRERMDERITIATPDILYGMTSSGTPCPHYPQRLRKILNMPLPLSLPKGGNGNAGLTHVRNAADALLILAEHLVAGDLRVAGHEFIISDMNKVTWGQWFKKWGEIFNIPKEVGNMPYHLFRMLGFANEILHRITFGFVPLVMSRLGAELFNGMTCDSSRLRKLGWHPSVSYEDGMREVQEYYTRTS